MVESDARVSQFEPTVGSTSWLDLRAKRDRQRQWLNDAAKPPLAHIPKPPQGAENLSPGGPWGLWRIQNLELNNFASSKKASKKTLRKLRNQEVETPNGGSFHRGASALSRSDGSDWT
jgi:hypothetical protein